MTVRRVLDAAWRRLPVDADVVRGGQDGPIHLGEILRRWDVGNRLVIDTHRRPAGALLKRQDRYEVVVYRHPDAPLRRGRERFTIGHEIGHFWFATRYGGRPRDEREWSDLEDYCDAFANRLLIPSPLIHEALARAPETAVALHALTHKVAQRADVSFATVAHRLAREVSDASFCSIDARGQRDGLGVVTWSCQSSPWHGATPLRSIDARSVLGAVIGAAARATGVVRQVHVADIDAAVERRGHSIYVTALLNARRRTRAENPNHPRATAGRQLQLAL